MPIVVFVSHNGGAMLGNLSSDELTNQTGEVRLHDDVLNLVHILYA